MYSIIYICIVTIIVYVIYLYIYIYEYATWLVVPFVVGCSPGWSSPPAQASARWWPSSVVRSEHPGWPRKRQAATRMITWYWCILCWYIYNMMMMMMMMMMYNWVDAYSWSIDSNRISLCAFQQADHLPQTPLKLYCPGAQMGCIVFGFW